MSDAVMRALQQAAERAERHAVLNTAHATLERVLGFPHPPELLPWGAALSTSYLFQSNHHMTSSCDIEQHYTVCEHPMCANIKLPARVL